MRLNDSVRSTTAWLADHPATVFAAWASWLSLMYVVMGPHSYVRIHDNADSTLAMMVYAAKFGHSFDTWLPVGLTGNNELADGYTYNLLLAPFVWLPGWLAYFVVMFLQRFIGGYFMFKLLRDHSGVCAGTAMVGGLVYGQFAQPAMGMWNGFSLSHGMFEAAIPAVCWSVGRLTRARVRVGVPAALLVGICFALTTHFPFAMFLVPALVAWFILFAPERRRVAVCVLLGSFMLGWIVAELPAVLGAVREAATSQRAAWGLASGVDDGLALQVMRDNAALVVVALLGVLHGFRSRGSRNRRIAGLLGAAALCAAWPPFAAWLQYGGVVNVGWLRGLQLSRTYLLLPFLLVPAAALSADDLLTGSWASAVARSRFVARLALATAIALVGLSSVQTNLRMAVEMVAGSNYRALFQRDVLDGLGNTDSYRFATVIDRTEVSAQHPAFAWTAGLETVDGYSRLYPARYHDYWDRVIAPVLEQDPATAVYFRDWGNRAYLFQPSAEDGTDRPIDFSRYYDSKLLTLANTRYVISPVPLRGEGLRTLHEPSQSDRHSRARNLYARQVRTGRAPDTLYVYELLGAKSRAFVARKVLVVDAGMALETVASLSAEQLGTTAVVEKGTPGDRARPGGATNARVRGIAYVRNGLDVTVETEEESVLIVTHSYTPSWVATVDDEEGDVFPVDHAFVGVRLPAGARKVTLRYR